MAVWGGVRTVLPYSVDNDAGWVQINFLHPLSFFARTDSRLPFYRPLGELTDWIQYQFFGIDPSIFFVVNILIWIGVGVIVYFLVRLLTKSSLAGLLAGLALVVEGRAESVIFTIGDRSASLACLFGGAALLLAYRASFQGRVGLISGGGIVVLLIGAFLSKEYGLAFGFAVALIGLLTRPDKRWILLSLAVGAVVIYGAMRVGLAGSVNTGYCDGMGFFWKDRSVCFGHAQPPQYPESTLLTGGARLEQHAWNVGSMFVGTFLPGLFDAEGTLRYVSFASFLNDAQGAQGGRLVLHNYDFVPALVVLGLAILGWIKEPRRSLPFLGLIVANAVLSAYLYRTRNQIGGLVGLYASAGIGWGVLQARCGPLFRRRVLPVAGLAAIGVLVALIVLPRGSAMVTREKELVAPSAVAHLCTAAVRRGDYQARFPLGEKLNEYYGWPRGLCTSAAAKSQALPPPPSTVGLCGAASRSKETGPGLPVATPEEAFVVHHPDSSGAGTAFTASVTVLLPVRLSAASICEPPRAGVGHLHFILDGGKYDTPAHSSASIALFRKEHSIGRFSPTATGSVTYQGLPTGSHVFEVILFSNDHSGRAVYQVVPFQVHS
jgi:hypothetical protein